MSGENRKVLRLDNMNPNIIKMEYAVRGPLVIRASAIEKELEQVMILIVVDLKGLLKFPTLVKYLQANLIIIFGIFNHVMFSEYSFIL